MAETEKITINMNVVELGKVDLLVEQGFYSNRTDFIKAAIRSQLTTHTKVLDEIITAKSFCLGISYFNKEDLEKLADQNKILDIKVVGMLILADDISVELATQTIKSIKVYGVFKGSAELKAMYN